jgi:hypothetical protein
VRGDHWQEISLPIANKPMLVDRGLLQQSEPDLMALGHHDPVISVGILAISRSPANEIRTLNHGPFVNPVVGVSRWSAYQPEGSALAQNRDEPP